MLISHRPHSVTLASTSTIAKTAAREKFELGAQEQLQVTPASEVANQAIDTTLEFPSFFNPMSQRQENYNATKDKNDDFSVTLSQAINAVNKVENSKNSKEITSKAYGYSVDSKGFMGADFNAAAGLPDGFKIHKSTLDTIVDNAESETKFFNQLAGSSVSVVNVDVANTIGQYYSLFTQLVGTEKNSFSSAELSSLPAGYKNDKMKKDSATDFWDYTDAIVTHIFSANDIAELEKLQENNPAQRGIMPWKLDFSSQHLKESRNGFDMSVYKSDDGYSVENVFVAFIDSHSGLPLKGGKTEFSSEFPKTEFLTEIPVDKILADQKKYDDLLASVLMMIDEKKDGSVFSKDNDESTKKLMDSVKAIYARAMV